MVHAGLKGVHKSPGSEMCVFVEVSIDPWEALGWSLLSWDISTQCTERQSTNILLAKRLKVQGYSGGQLSTLHLNPSYTPRYRVIMSK